MDYHQGEDPVQHAGIDTVGLRFVRYSDPEQSFLEACI